MNTSTIARSRRPLAGTRSVLLVALVLLVAAGCDRGPRGAKGKPGDPAVPADPVPTNSVLTQEADVPALEIEVLGLEGASGAGGEFMVGDSFGVTFRLTQDDGSPWGIAELDRLRILVAGPTFNYQQIFAEALDVITASVKNADGSYTYTFPTTIPAVYPPPLNDTVSFGLDDGELAGEALLSGAYTVGMYGRWPYTVDGETFVSIGNTTFDFLLGEGAVMQHREVVTQANCNTCHADLQAHGGQRKDVGLCLLCHTKGSEDRNTPSVAGGTPGVTISMVEMIHRIHNGAHLPSVLGVTTDPDTGERIYDAEEKPYQVMGFGNALVDYSHIAFPLWPNLVYPMPRDQGYTALDPEARAAEDAMRSGVTACDKCHGDPDGDGPLPPPEQGMLAYQQPTRASCGSCHDDIVWEGLYTANGQTMPAQANDSACVLCHEVSGSPLDVIDAHRHPLLDPDITAGLNVDVTAVEAAGFAGSALQAGDRLLVTFTITDDLGNDVLPGDIAALSAAVVGPTSNMNLLVQSGYPTSMLVGDPPYTLPLPQPVLYELVDFGTSDPDVFATALAPHWSGTTTAVRVVTGPVLDGGLDPVTGVLAVEGSAPQNYIDLDDTTDFLRNQTIVIDAGLPEEEYLVIQFVDGDRLWFGSQASTAYPFGLRHDHPAGATVAAVLTSDLVAGDDYTLDAETGAITEVADSFVDGNAVLASYTTDFRLPATYPVPLNDSPDLGQEVGDWSGLALLDGTYRVQFWGYRNVPVALYGESQTYRDNMDSPAHEFVVGNEDLEPWDLISSANNCYQCHDQILFHGSGRGGVDTCLACHGAAGSEDRPPYVAPNAPDTTGTSILFRDMIHKIHMGSDLAKASEYTVVGFGSNYPNNFSEHHYDEVVFPAFPSGVKACFTCHGTENDAWKEPSPRSHPDAIYPTRNWGVSCGSCHDSDAAGAHIEVQTAVSGAESCAICHGPGKDSDVEVVHRIR